MGRICAFGVYVIGADCRNACVFKGPTQCCLTVDCVVSIEIRRSDEDQDCLRSMLGVWVGRSSVRLSVLMFPQTLDRVA